MTSSRVRGNSLSALNLKIKKKEEEKDAIKHGTRIVSNESRSGKKEYKYWDSNKRKYVKQENLTTKKVKPKVKTQSGLTKAELDKKQKDINLRRRQGEGSSRTDKGYQKEDTPLENKDTSTESSNNVTQKQLDAKIKERKLRKKYGEVTQEQLDKKIANPDAKVKGKDKPKDSLKIKKGSARNFIKTKKGFARRGTPMAKRAEERERKRKALAAKGYMKNR